MSSGPTVRALSFVNGTLLAPRSNPSLACSPCLHGSVALPAGLPSSCCPSKPLQFQPVGRLANLRCSLPLLPGLKGNLCMYTPEITSACCAAMLAGFTPWEALLLPLSADSDILLSDLWRRGITVSDPFVLSCVPEAVSRCWTREVPAFLTAPRLLSTRHRLHPRW